MYLPEVFKREKPGGHFCSVMCRMGCLKFEVIVVVGIGLLKDTKRVSWFENTV